MAGKIPAFSVFKKTVRIFHDHSVPQNMGLNTSIEMLNHLFPAGTYLQLLCYICPRIKLLYLPGLLSDILPGNCSFLFGTLYFVFVFPQKTALFSFNLYFLCAYPMTLIHIDAANTTMPIMPAAQKYRANDSAIAEKPTPSSKYLTR